MCDFVLENVPNDGDKLGFSRRFSFDRGTEERDRVGKPHVLAAALCQWDAVVQAQQSRLIGRWPVLDRHVDGVQLLSHPGWKIVDHLADQVLKPLSGYVRHVVMTKSTLTRPCSLCRLMLFDARTVPASRFQL